MTFPVLYACGWCREPITALTRQTHPADCHRERDCRGRQEAQAVLDAALERDLSVVRQAAGQAAWRW